MVKGGIWENVIIFNVASEICALRVLGERFGVRDQQCLVSLNCLAARWDDGGSRKILGGGWGWANENRRCGGVERSDDANLGPRPKVFGICSASVRPNWIDVPPGNLSGHAWGERLAVLSSRSEPNLISPHICADLNLRQKPLFCQFIQLPGINVSLVDGSSSQNEGEKSYPNSGTGGYPRRPFLSIFLFLVGAAFAKLAYEITDQPTCGWGSFTFAFSMWTVAFVLIFQATILSLSGEWVWNFLASGYSRSENVGIEPIVVAELKFRDVQSHVFGTDLVEATNNTAFEDAPEAFNRVGMNRADNILLAVVIDRLMIVFGQPVINAAFVSGEQANFVGNHFPNEALSGFAGDVFQNARNDIALAADGTNDRSFGGRAMSALAPFTVPMFVFVLPADEGLVNFDDAAKLIHVLFDQGSPDFVAHEPSGFDRTEAHVATDLARTHALFAGQHEVGNFEPVAERFVGVLEDRPCDDRKPIAIWGAFLALPMPLARRKVIDSGVAATRTADALRPSAGLQIGFAGIFIADWKQRIELGGSQLVNWLGLASRHGENPSKSAYFGSLAYV
jgi:hypothetical protein